MFYVGQRVVRLTPCNRPVVKPGEVYTISGFAPSPWNPEVPPGLLLHRVPHGRFRNGAPKGFNPHKFRPVCDKKTDISVFTALLDTTKTPQHA